MIQEQVQIEHQVEWALSVQAQKGGLKITKKIKVEENVLSEIFDSAKTKCSRCEIDLIGIDAVMDELEGRYGNVISELHGDIYSVVSDVISTRVQESQDFDYPHLCVSCAYAVKD